AGWDIRPTGRETALPERDLGKAPELARMQPFRLLSLQLRHCLEADFEVLIDLPAVEFARHAGKLELTLQWLVRDAQERAVGHAEAKAVGGDGGRFHVERDGTRL